MRAGFLALENAIECEGVCISNIACRKDPNPILVNQVYVKTNMSKSLSLVFKFCVSNLKA